MNRMLKPTILLLTLAVGAALAGECVSDPEIDYSGRDFVGSDRPPRLADRLVEPVYPADAPEDWRGSCLLLVTVDERGLVIEVEVLESSGLEAADAAAVAAVEASDWLPAVEDGERVVGEVEREVRFHPAMRDD